MARVILEQLVKTYPVAGRQAGHPVVKGISLEIQDGEFMVLVGPSGCGKSTTLRMIAGLEEIDSGRILIGDRVVNGVPPKDRDIAMVFQNYALYPHLNVRENMEFGLRLRRMDPAEIDCRVGEAATLLGLGPLLDRRPKALSGGQRQRVAVGRAIVRQPKVFLFDEPLSNLDAAMRVQLRTELARLHARLGCTMIYVTHDQVEAMTMGDRICVMHDGVVAQVDAPLALYRRPANLFTAGFVGSPAMNFFAGTIETDDDGPRFVEHNDDGEAVVVRLPAHLYGAAQTHLGRKVVLGLRPEDVSPDVAPPGHGTVARVEIAEPMGAETLVHLSSGATAFVVRANPGVTYRTGQDLAVRFNLERVHLFDPTTQRALAC